MFRRSDDYDGDGRPNEDAPDFGNERAMRYFPDMVNHLILGPVPIVPRPCGPRVDGIDVFERAFAEAVGSSRDVRFVDDWLVYHEMSGEVHCGTNVRRSAPIGPKWWTLRPRGWDASIPRAPTADR